MRSIWNLQIRVRTHARTKNQAGRSEWEEGRQREVQTDETQLGAISLAASEERRHTAGGCKPECNVSCLSANIPPRLPGHGGGRTSSSTHCCGHRCTHNTPKLLNPDPSIPEVCLTSTAGWEGNRYDLTLQVFAWRHCIDSKTQRICIL